MWRRLLQPERLSLTLARLHPKFLKGPLQGLCQAVMMMVAWHSVCVLRRVSETCDGEVWLDGG